MDLQSDPHLLGRRIAELAAKQFGVVSRAQLERAGMTAEQVKHRVRSGSLHRVHRGVYALGHRCISGDARLMAAVLACGDGAVASHRSAGSWLGMRPSASAMADVSIPSRAGRQRRDGIRIHRPRTLLPSEVTRHLDLPVTTPARTLLDLAAVVPRYSLERAVERAETLLIFDLTAVEEVLKAHPRSPGHRSLTAVLELQATPAFTRSDLEALFLGLCRKGGLPQPKVNTYVHDIEVDFFWPDERLIVETDSRRHHGTSRAFEDDRARDAHFTAAGYRVLRFTYRQVLYEPAYVIGILRSVIARPRTLETG